MSPSLNCEIRLGVEANAKNHDSKKTSNITWKLPILPFTGLTWWRWRPIEKIAFGALLVTGTGPPALSGGGSTAGAERREKAVPEHIRGVCKGRRRGHFELIFRFQRLGEGSSESERGREKERDYSVACDT